MKYSEFKNIVKNGKPSAIYLFEGEDGFFRERGVNLLKSQFVKEPEMNYAVFSGEKLSEKELTASLIAYPFMSEYRLTVLREYYPKKDSLGKELSEYFANPCSGGILAIVNEKPCDTLKKIPSVTVVDCKKEDASIIARWIYAKCLSANVKTDMQTAKTLAEYCLCDMVRIENETEKLICYCLEKKELTVSDVELLVNRDVEYKIYEMTDFVAKKQFAKALDCIYDMIAKGEATQKISVSVYNYFRRLLHVAISDKSDAELSKLLGIQPFAVKKTREQAKGFKKKSLKNAVDLLSERDFSVKSGKSDAEDGFWLDIFKIITL